jgi:hypothetical protein
MRYAKNLEGKKIHISKSDRKTNYFCLICNSPVVVKKGAKKEHHYAHLQNTGDDCQLKYKDLYENHSTNKPKDEVIKNEVKYTIQFVEEKKQEKSLEEIIKEIKSKYTLTTCQDKGIDEFFKWYETDEKDKKYYTISGLSGSGKTFLIKIVTEIFEAFGEFDYNVVSFTGKSVNVLKERGLKNISTLHSLMYKPVLDKDDKIVGWSRNYSLECNFIIVDEFSMLSQSMIDDLLLYDIPILFSGDHRQISPVSASDNNLISSVDFHLSTVVRQQEGSPIIKHANLIREGKLPTTEFRDKNEFGSFSVISKDRVTKEKLEKNILKYDMVLVGRNTERVRLNTMIRRLKGYNKKILNNNEILMVLKNQGEFFNGQQIIIEEVLKTYDNGLIYVKTNEGNIYISDYFLINELEDISKVHKKKYYLAGEEIKPIYATYGYCSTSYKAQGSTCDKCLVFGEDMRFAFTMATDKKVGWDNFVRLIYTSCTRAKSEVLLVIK